MGIAGLMKDRDGLRYFGAATGYAVIAYVLGFAGLFHGDTLINVVATLLLAHGMTIAAYLIHECGHNLVFAHSRHNAMLGRFLSWLCGAAYGTYEDMRYKHFRHHVDNDDVVWFDYDRFFEEHPRLTKATRLLEWLYIPAHDLIMHTVMVFTSFIIPHRRKQRPDGRKANGPKRQQQEQQHRVCEKRRLEHQTDHGHDDGFDEGH